MTNYTICPACKRKNSIKEKYCLNCGQKLIEDEENIKSSQNKLEILKSSFWI